MWFLLRTKATTLPLILSIPLCEADVFIHTVLENMRTRKLLSSKSHEQLEKNDTRDLRHKPVYFYILLNWCIIDAQLCF